MSARNEFYDSCRFKWAHFGVTLGSLWHYFGYIFEIVKSRFYDILPKWRLWRAKVAILVTLARQGRNVGDFGMPKSPFWRLWRAYVSRQFGDFGVPKSPVWRLWHAKVTILATLARLSRHFGDFGVPKSPFW